MFPTLQHPERHVWDFWYWFDPALSQFHVFYLNADKPLFALGQHHDAARLGYAVTPDFQSIDWGDESQWEVLTAHADDWDNTAIWSGDILRIQTGYLLFYTSRDRHQDNGTIQNIGMAYATTPRGPWHRTLLRLQPGGGYVRQHVAGDRAPHAWRDPFLFLDEGQIYMVISAKSSAAPLGKNGTVGLLQLRNNDFSAGVWDILDAIASPQWYAEMEVPQLYRDAQGRYHLVFSTWAKNDFAPTTQQCGGLHAMTSSVWRTFDQPPSVLLPEASGLYACRIIPELDGEIVGFDLHTGGIRRSGIKTQFQGMDRDFSRFAFLGSRLRT